MVPFMEELYALAKVEDDTRLVTHAVNHPVGRKWKSDLYAWNYYPGWYGASRHDLGRFMGSQHRAVKSPSPSPSMGRVAVSISIRSVKEAPAGRRLASGGISGPLS